ncbi:putative 39S ribosomal protein [Naja naja]|nr:putative 39S ribosomal protein [Naja naja]
MAASRAPGGGNRMKALELLRSLPRVSLGNLRPNPGARRKRCKEWDSYEDKGVKEVGIELHLNVKLILRRQYPPISLRKLQYLIDLGRIDPMQPIDLTQLTNARGVTLQPFKRHYGIHLVEEASL